MKDINDSDFVEEVLKADKPVLVDVWAEWCAPCKAIANVLGKLSAKRQDIKIVKVDADSNPEIMNRLDITTLPTLVLFHDGYMVGSRSGVVRIDALETWIDEQLAEED